MKLLKRISDPNEALKEIGNRAKGKKEMELRKKFLIQMKLNRKSKTWHFDYHQGFQLIPAQPQLFWFMYRDMIKHASTPRGTLFNIINKFLRPKCRK